MWEMDNDRHQLQRLEHELAVRRADRLLNSVTATDRIVGLRLPGLSFGVVVQAAVRCRKWLYSSIAVPSMVRRAPE